MNNKIDQKNASEDSHDNIKFWFTELEEAQTREKAYRKEGKRINEIYESVGEKRVPFNILFSNTETMLPALYSAIPRPVVQRRFKDDDPIAKAATVAGTRLLEYLLDTNVDGYESFNEGMLNTVTDALLPGRGVTRIKYDSEIGEYNNDAMDEAGNGESDGFVKESETICVDSIGWDKVFFGYAKKWSKVPWVAFEEIIDKDEAIRLFGKEIANRIKFLKNDEDEEASSEDEHEGERKTATIYQIWDKDGGRKIRYVSKHYKDDFLKVDDDPLELTGFYPMPRPLTLMAKSNSLEVTAPYLVYEEQAKELNEVTRRRTRVLKAIRAKGIYDAELGSDIENLMDGDDNTLVPADKSAVLSDKGFENSIWFMPIEQLIKVYVELTNAQQSIKQIIYEITGISDIIRGSTNASETATAQNIKSQWGTMRLKRNQGEVQRYARDMMRIMLEIAATKFSEQAWLNMTNLPYATEQQAQQAQMIMQAAQQYGPQIPPQFQQQIQQAQQLLQQPQWSQVLDLLKNDVQRSYRIDIETNSTVMPEATEDKQNINEALTALSAFIKESLPVVQAGLLPFEGFKAILLKISRQFQFGDEIEEELKSMQQPPPPQPEQLPPDNTLQIKQMEMQSAQQSEQNSAQMEIQKTQANNALEMQKMEAQRLIEQGKAETQLRIKEMEIQSAESIAQFKTTTDAETRIYIAQMQISNKEQEADDKNDAEDAGDVIDSQQIMDEHKKQFDALMEYLHAPKQIIRGPDGVAIGIQ